MPAPGYPWIARELQDWKSLIEFTQNHLVELALIRVRLSAKALLLVLLLGGIASAGVRDVKAVFDYSISVNPSSAPDLLAGANATASVRVALVGTDSRAVTLTATKSPNEPSITVSLTPTSGTPTFTSTLEISTLISTPEGSYMITITGNSAPPVITHTATFLLTVNAYRVSLSPLTGTILPGGSVKTNVIVDGIRETVFYSYQIKFVDSNGNGQWDSGEPVILDSNDNGQFDSGETVIATPTPTTGTPLRFDLAIGFVDANNDNSRNIGEAVAYDLNDNNAYDSGEPVIAGTPIVGNALKRSQLIAGTVPGARALKDDVKIMLVDSNNDNLWNSGETVVYDSNNDLKYDSADPVIAGTAPSLGTALKDDPKIKFVDPNNNNAWNAPEVVTLSCPGLPTGVSCSFAVTSGTPSYLSELTISTLATIPPESYSVTVRGISANTLITKTVTFTLLVPGLLLDPIITTGPVGTEITVNVALKGFPSFNSFDIVIAYTHDSQGGPLDALEIIVPTADLDVWPPGVVPTTFSNVDSKIKYVDSNNNRVWDLGETAVYDTDADGKYDTGEPVIVGTAPANQALLNDHAKLKYVDIVQLKDDLKIKYVDFILLKDDFKIKHVDPNNNGVRDSTEAVIYDSDNDFLFDSGEIVIVGSTPAVGTVLKDDAKIKYQDFNNNDALTFTIPREPVVYDTNGNNLYDAGEPVITGTPSLIDTGTWSIGEAVVYDNDGDNLFDTGEPVLTGTTPADQTPLKDDPKIKYQDFNSNNVRDGTEPVVYDGDNSNVFDPGEPTVTGTPSPANVWSPGEPVVFDSNNNGLYDAGEPLVVGTTAAGTTLKTDLLVGEVRFSQTAVAPTQTGTSGTLFSIRFKVVAAGFNELTFKKDLVNLAAQNIAHASRTGFYLDSTNLKRFFELDWSDYDNNGKVDINDVANAAVVFDVPSSYWDLNVNVETVVYDGNTNNLYDSGETVIGPPSGTAPTAGSSLKDDPPIKYVDVNSNNVWNIGETVVYDSSKNGLFDTGEAVIAGLVPNPGTSLKDDPKIKYFDTNLNNVWTPGTDIIDIAVIAVAFDKTVGLETVVYDVNANNQYDGTDPVILGIRDIPVIGTPLKDDPRIKYFDSNANGVWNLGETVAYDSNGNGSYDIGEVAMVGTVPTAGTALKDDSKIKYFDSSNEGVWNSDSYLGKTSPQGKMDPAWKGVCGSLPEPLKTYCNTRI